jgi:hypothetical protein
MADPRQTVILAIEDAHCTSAAVALLSGADD